MAGAASLASNGVFAPLLLTDEAARLPEPLESYLLSVQPGYEDDPGQAVYNRAWVLGDEEAISVTRAGADRPDHRADPSAGERAVGELLRHERVRAIGPAAGASRPSRTCASSGGASTPHFALQLRNRIRNLIAGLPADHPARVEGDREIARLDSIALGSERRGPIQEHEHGMPSLRDLG